MYDVEPIEALKGRYDRVIRVHRKDLLKPTAEQIKHIADWQPLPFSTPSRGGSPGGGHGAKTAGNKAPENCYTRTAPRAGVDPQQLKKGAFVIFLEQFQLLLSLQR